MHKTPELNETRKSNIHAQAHGFYYIKQNYSVLVPPPSCFEQIVWSMLTRLLIVSFDSHSAISFALETQKKPCSPMYSFIWSDFQSTCYAGKKRVHRCNTHVRPTLYARVLRFTIYCECARVTCVRCFVIFHISSFNYSTCRFMFWRRSCDSHIHRPPDNSWGDSIELKNHKLIKTHQVYASNYVRHFGHKFMGAIYTCNVEQRLLACWFAWAKPISLSINCFCSRTFSVFCSFADLTFDQMEWEFELDDPRNRLKSIKMN